jgi:hypothetical protein
MEKRRVTDLDKTQEIEALILEEDDKRMRTVLLVVQSLNVGIREQTAEQRQSRLDFEEYQRKIDERMLTFAQQAEQFSAHINRSAGMRVALGWGWKLVAAVAMAAQAAIIAIGSHYAAKLDALDAAIQWNATQHAVIEERLKGIGK